jgi:hypothetical protein
LCCSGLLCGMGGCEPCGASGQSCNPLGCCSGSCDGTTQLCQ